jgi:hypothetical protein
MLEKIEPALEEVQQLFEEWRRNKKGRDGIPGALWKAAISLSKQYSAHQISKLLHLNHTAVRDHIRADNQDEGIGEKGAAFIEFDVVVPPEPDGDCVIEIEKRGGSRMRLSFKGSNPEIVGLAKILWSEA